MSRPLRRHPDAEPVRDAATDPRLDEGIALFNQGKHWHAHEAWEQLWLGLEGEDKWVVQGFIMAAAMLVQYDKGVRPGVQNHHRNVLARLQGAGDRTWGIDVADLLRQLVPYVEDADGGELLRDPADVQIHRVR